MGNRKGAKLAGGGVGGREAENTAQAEEKGKSGKQIKSLIFLFSFEFLFSL